MVARQRVRFSRMPWHNLRKSHDGDRLSLEKVACALRYTTGYRKDCLIRPGSYESTVKFASDSRTHGL